MSMTTETSTPSTVTPSNDDDHHHVALHQSGGASVFADLDLPEQVVTTSIHVP